MKKILLFLLMLLPVGATEGVVESQEVLTPWNMDSIRQAIGCDPYYDLLSVRHFVFPEFRCNLIREGMFDKLREEFFPQIDATFRVSDNRITYLSTEQTNLDDLVAYYNLSTICAAFHMLLGENNYLAQQDSEKRKSILNKLKSILYDMHRSSCNDETATDMRMGAGEDYPLYVVIRKYGCSSIRLFILAKTDVIPRYLRFDMRCASVDTVKSKLDKAKEHFSRLIKSYKINYEIGQKPKSPEELNQMREDLSFTEFYLAVKGLSPMDEKCRYRELKTYTIGEIEEMLLGEWW